MAIDREYRIRIATVADNSGTDEAGHGVAELGKKTEEAGEHAKLFNAHGREMHQLIHGLEELAPGAGLALRAMVHPDNIAAAGLVLILHQVLKAVEEYKKKLEEARQQAAELSTAVWEAQRDRAYEAADAARQYAEALKAIAEKVDGLKAKEELELATLNAQVAARKALIEAQEKGELAGAGGDKEKEAEIRRRYGHAQTQSELQGQQDRIALEQRQLEEEQRKKDEAKAKAATAEAAKENGPPDTKEVAEAKKWLEQHKDDVTKAQSRLDAAQKAAGGKSPEQLRADAELIARSGDENAAVGASIYFGQASDLEKATKALDEAKAANEAATKKVKEHEVAVDALNIAEEAAQKELDKYTQAVAARTAQIAKDQAVYNINKETQATIDNVEIESALKNLGVPFKSKLGKTILQAIDIEEAAGVTGNKLNGQDAQLIQQIAAAMRQSGASQDEITSLLQEFMDLHVDHARKIHDISQYLPQLKAQIDAMSGRPPNT